MERLLCLVMGHQWNEPKLDIHRGWYKECKKCYNRHYFKKDEDLFD